MPDRYTKMLIKLQIIPTHVKEISEETHDVRNIFVIAAGPITGTKLWSQSRFGVYSTSPATEIMMNLIVAEVLLPESKAAV